LPCAPWLALWHSNLPPTHSSSSSSSHGAQGTRGAGPQGLHQGGRQEGPGPVWDGRAGCVLLRGVMVAAAEVLLLGQQVKQQQQQQQQSEGTSHQSSPQHSSSPPGGVSFFNVAVDEPNGDMAMLEKVMEGCNALVDEAAEERKGGAGDIGKFLLSAGDEQLVAYGHMPKALEEKGLTLKVGGSGG